jgi:hypothetical protein
VLWRADANRSRGPLAQVGQSRDPVVDVAQRRPQGLDQPLTGVGRGDAPRRAGEKAKAELRLQPPHRVAERRLRDAELRGRPGEAALLRDRKEHGEAAQLFTPHDRCIFSRVS